MNLFLLLPFYEAFILLRFLFLEYHIFWYLIAGSHYQNHIHDNMFLFNFNNNHFFPKHCMGSLFMWVIISLMIHWVANETLIYNETKFIIVPQFLLLPNLFSIFPLHYVDILFTKFIYLSFNSLFKFFRFHWQHSLGCPNLLHCPQIMSICLPSLVFLV